MLAALLVAVLPIFVAFGWTAYQGGRAGLDEELGARLESIAGSVAATWMSTRDAERLSRLEADSNATRERLHEQLVRIRDATGVERIRVLSPELRSLVDTETVEPFSEYFDLQADSHELGGVFGQSESASSVLFRADDGRRFKRGYAPVVFDGEVIAAVAAESPAAFFELLDRYRGGLIGFGLASLALCVAITAFLSRRIGGPLSRLEGVARRIGAGNLTVEVPELGGDEIGSLARAIRSMRDELAERDEQMQLMLAGIAHEIRNPLGGMELFVGLLEEELADRPESKKHAAKVRRELDYLTRVVGEFLAFARDRPLEVRRIGARELLHEVAESVRRLGDERGVRIDVSVDEEGLMLSGDREALRGVLQNLVQNGVQACGAGGAVRLRAESEGVAARRVVVEDDGCGMPEEVATQAFRPFFTTREKGTGLGLPLARRVVDRHGGSLRLTSRPGAGTRVEIALPWDETAPDCAAATSSGSVPSQPPAGGWDGEMIG